MEVEFQRKCMYLCTFVSLVGKKSHYKVAPTDILVENEKNLNRTH